MRINELKFNLHGRVGRDFQLACLPLNSVQLPYQCLQTAAPCPVAEPIVESVCHSHVNLTLPCNRPCRV